MQISSRYWKALGFGLVIAVVALIGIRTWVVPALIVGQVQAKFAGKVTIRDWWLNGHSAGVVGLTLHEGPTDRSPVFASAERVATDLSLAGLLRGRLAPRLIRLERPEVTFRLDRDGRFLNLPEMRGGDGGGSEVPSIAIEGARVTFHQAGRPAMVVSGVEGRIEAGREALEVSARADDPTWGDWKAGGRIDSTFASGRVWLGTDRAEADPEKLARVPFVPAEVWTHVGPRGPVGVRLDLDWASGRLFQVRTEVAFLGTEATFPTLGLETTDTTGVIRFEGGVVHVVQVRGRAIDGTVAANGTLDFAQSPPRVHLELDLTRINIADAPKSWQLDEAGVTGQLTGKVQLVALLDPGGVDLSGSSGEAVVEGGTIQGIPVKSLKLTMHAEGSDLQYSNPPSAARVRRAVRVMVASLALLHAGSVGQSLLPWDAAILVALQAAPSATEEPTEPRRPGVQLPKALTTQIELQDVDVKQLVAKAQFLTGFPFPIPITGRLSLKASATIPLGALRDVKRYAFHGDLTLTGASIARIDFGRLEARIDLADGVLDLSNLRGRLVDHPEGGPDNPPDALPPVVAAEGPLPPGGFRANVHAALAPPGQLTVQFDGNQLPLGELAAPALPRPTPLAGLASMHVEAQADLGAVRDPDAWTASGQVHSEHITYQGAALDRLATQFDLKEGTLHLPDFTAQLAGRPLSARLGIDLKPPQAFEGTVDVTGWDLGALLALMPSAPHPAPVSGTLSAHAEAKGTLAPRSVETRGQGRLGRFQAGPVPLGDVPFRWTTDGDTVVVSGVEAHPFGGRLTAEARVPVVPGKPTRGSATFTAIDTARITAAIPGQELKLTGTADGQVTFSIPADVSAVDATVRLEAPDLTVQGIPAEQVQAGVRAHGGVLKYEVTAESLGGRIRFQGDFPLNAPAGQAAATGELRAVGFALDQAWKALGVTGALAQLNGQGAVDANIRDVLSGTGAGLWVHGIAEFRNLSWGANYPLGRLRGIVALTPTVWRVDDLGGELLGGLASGFLWGTTAAQGPRRLGFSFRIDNAALKRVLASLPTLARTTEGYASLRLAGDLNEVFRSNAEVRVTQGRIAGLPLSELLAPAEVVVYPDSGSGVVQVRRWSARLAGGQVRGDASFRLGANRAFETAVQLAALDLPTIARIETDVARPGSGKISGRISLNGPSPELVQRYRGTVDLELTDASLVSLPIFREIDRFLGSARGGLFEDGILTGTIANKQLTIEQFELEGRLAQLHATGTVGFDGQLNLEVLINTNQIIPETGQALIARIPGLREVLGRSEEATLRIANFLSNRLLKLRVSGTVRNPAVALDPTIVVADTALAFFTGVLKLPLGLVK